MIQNMPSKIQKNNWMKNRNILKGRIFEFVIKHLFDKAWFTQENIPSDQLTVSGKKRIHWRWATYDPDYYWALLIGIPFSNPIMVVVEAKFLAKKVDIKIAREFLWASIDFMQFTRINTKQSGKSRYNDMIMPRFSMLPVIISRKWFDANAKGLLYAHGIKFIWYDDSGIFKNIADMLDEFLSTVNYAKFTKKTFWSIVDMESLGQMSSEIKKTWYSDKLQSLTSYITKINSSIAILGYQHTVNVIIYPEYKSKKNRYDTTFKIRYGWDGLFFLVRWTSKTTRSKIWEFYFPITKTEFDRLQKKIEF